VGRRRRGAGPSDRASLASQRACLYKALLPQLCRRNAHSLGTLTAKSDDRGFKDRWLNSKWRGRDGNDPSVDIAKDADQRFRGPTTARV
jgi:hypothetical protein